MFNRLNTIFISNKHTIKAMRFFLSFIFLCLILIQTSKSQSLEEHEDKLLLLFEKLNLTKSDSARDAINNEILKKFKYCLHNEKSFSYPFAKLKNIGKIKSDDDLIRIYTWNLMYKDGTFKYFGFIQNYFDGEFNFFQLNDASDKIENPQNVKLSEKNWFGVLYYKIVTKKYKRKKYYTLLGWDGNDNFSNKKIIETLQFDEDGIPIFGISILQYEKKILNRIIFEYTEQSQMMLRYDKKQDMIIWDHLSPPKEELTGQYRFYGPDFSYDGIFFNKGKWDFYSNLNLKNER